MAEPPLSSVEAIIDGLVPELTTRLDKPYAFYGHSMGAKLGFELIRRLSKLNLPLPQAFFICAANSPEFKSLDKIISSLSDKEFLEELRSLGATPEEFLSDPELMSLFLPVLRADFEAVEKHSYGDISPIDIPVMVFGGLDDKEVSIESLIAWRKVTTASFSVHLFQGDHFFVFSKMKAVVKSIHSALIGSD